MTGSERLQTMLKATNAADKASREHEKMATLYSRAYGADCNLAAQHRNAARRAHEQAERLRNEWLDRHSL